MSISLPISIGEGVDKLSILYIKKSKIKDDRLLNIEKEYDLLYEKLKFYITKYDKLYKSMININMLIWDQMNTIRNYEENPIKYGEICKDCLNNNDIRFRIKKKINNITNSILKEEKGYNIKRVIIQIINLKFNNSTILLNILEYLSLIFDEVIINSDNINYFKRELNYDCTIIFNKTCKEYEKKYIIDECNGEDELYQILECRQEEINKLI
jgi:hypothetical protein